MRFKGLDLNLLVALDALLDEKNVSRAAARLHVSQPAMSAALARMRDYFDDPILKLHGKRMVPTSHALRIHQDLKNLLGDVDSLISRTTFFDPNRSARNFTITASDYMIQVVFTPLLQKLRSIAPNIQVEFLPPSDSTHEMLAQGQIDLVFLPDQMLSERFPSEFLFEERFVIVGCETNPILINGVSEEEFYEASHVVVQLGRRYPQSVAEKNLEIRKRPRNSDVLISSFLLAPEVVVGTDRITVMHERLAKIFEKRLPITSTALPFEMPILKEHVQYHSTRVDDLGFQWIIGQVREIIADI